METQRPFNPDEDKDDIQNQATQRCDYTESTTTQKSMNDVSIYSAETQKNLPTNESTENLEIQKDDCRKSDGDKRMSIDVSIYSAETQKIISDEDIENLETQQFEVKSTDKFKVPDSSKRKSSNKSIHDIETQKCVPDTTINESLEDIETQRFSCETELSKRKISNESLDDLETQRLDNSTNFITHSVKENVDNQTLVEAKTQKRISESLEDIETQRFGCVETEFSKRKTTDESLDDLETQCFDNSTNFNTHSVKKNVDNQTLVKAKTKKRISESLEDIEIQRFSCVETELSNAKTTNESLNDLETQRFDNSTNLNTRSVKENTANQTLVKVKIQTKISEKSNDKSLDNSETRQFIKEYSDTVLNEPTENIEFHKLDNQNPSSSFSTEDMKAMPCIEDNLSLNISVQELNCQKPESHSYDSGFRSLEHESDREKANSMLSENYSDSHTIKSSSQSSFQQKNMSMTVSDSAEKINFQKECLDSTDLKRNDGVHSSSHDKYNVSNNCNNTKQADNTVDEDDEDIFCSQNLIEDCPFAFLPEESQNNDDQLDTMSKKMNQSGNNDTGNILIASTKFDKNTNKDVKNLSKMKQAMTLTEDSETDEEGIFSNNSCQEANFDNKNTNKDGNNLSKMKKALTEDSDTDEEGIFLNNVPHKDDNKSLNENNKKNDSETDEEGIFSNHASKEIEKRNTNKQNNEIQNSDSETDEEGIFSNCTEFKNKKSNKPNDRDNPEIGEKSGFSSDSHKKLDNNSSNINKSITSKTFVTDPGNENNLKSLESETKQKIVQKSPTPDSQDNIFDKNYNTDGINEKQNEKVSNPNDVNELASTQIVETEDIYLAVTQTADSKKQNEKISNSNEVIDELAPTQIVETATFETEDINLAVTQTADSNNSFSNTYNNKTNDVDDLAPTQIINVKKLENDDNSEDEFLAPTQIVSSHKRYIHSTEEDLEPTQIIPRGNSPVDKHIEQFDDLDLAPTQKIETEDLINRDEPSALYQSKRHLEEIEIGCNKKLKKADESQAVKIDLNTTIENNLNAMFEGAVEHSEEKEETLLTQQLENILESSQIENNSEMELNASLPSPTIGTRRKNIKGKIRRKAVILDKVNSPIEAKKLAANLNDTIERNLKEIFDESINPAEYEPEETLMTQQLKKVLESQDGTPSNAKEIGTLIKSQDFSPSMGKRHRLSLSINSNKKSKLSNVHSALDKSETTSQQSNSNEESQDTAEYFANLKSKKKYNVLDSQSEDDMMNRQLSSSSDKEIIYKRGTLGFSTEGKPVSTMERVAFLESKGRSFTSDSQSDGEEFNSALTNFKTCGKKRFSLSLSKNVDLNSSLSSMSDQEVDKKVCKEQKELNRKSTHISTIKIGSESRSVKKSNKDKINICDTARSVRRVRAPATIGFTDSLEPIQCDELVSAASTESEDAHIFAIKIDSESRSVKKSNKDKINTRDSARSLRRVRAPGIIGFTDFLEPIECDELVSAASTESEDEECRQQDYKSKNPSIVSSIRVATPNSRRKMASEQDRSRDIIADSDDEFLKTMPDIKVAGTSECPPTNSQLAAPSDNEGTDDELISIKDFEIKDKWNALARKRYDIIIRANQSNVKKEDSENIQNEIHSLNSTVEEITVKKTKINEIIAEIESTSSKKRGGRKVNLATNSENESDGKNDDKTSSRRHSTRVRSGRLAPESSSFIENSPGLEMDIVNCNSEKSFSKMNDEANSDSDSDNSVNIFPTYTPSKPINMRAMLHEKIKDEDNSDEEFIELRKKCEKMLNVQSTYATRKPPILKQTLKSKQKASPKNTRIAQKRALNNSNSLNITRSISDIKHEKSSPKTRTVDKDASILQVSSDSSMKRTTATSRMPGLTIIRNKRSMAPDVDDEQAQPTKRTKTTASDHRPKLQELSVPISPIKKRYLKYIPACDRPIDAYNTSNFKQATDTTSPTMKKKRATRAPKTLDGYVVLQKSKDTKIDSSDVSAISICVLDDKKESSIKPTRVGSRTRGKAAANNKKIIDSTIASNNSSKENVIVEDSDIESTPPKPKTRRGKSTRNQTDTNASVAKDSSTDNEEVKTRGRGTRRNQKKSETTNQANKSNQKTIIQDSDSENVEIAKSVNRQVKSTPSKAVQSSDSSDSGKIMKSTSSRSLRNKDSTLDDSENKLNSKVNVSGKMKNISSRSQRNKDSTLDDSENELKSKEKSLVKNLKSEELKTTQTRTMRNRKGPTNKGSESSITKQNKTRDKSSDSVFSESGDDNKQKNANTIKSKSLSSAKQTRKRPATTTASVIEQCSEESQEVAEILKNNEVQEAGNSRLRRDRITKKSTVSSSDHTHDSEDAISNSDEVFEKPVSRPKRGRLNKSVKNRSTSKLNLDEKKDIKSEHSRHHVSVFTRKNTPSPTRLRRAISVSPMKRPLHKVLFTGEKSEVHRRLVKKLGIYNSIFIYYSSKYLKYFFP